MSAPRIVEYKIKFFSPYDITTFTQWVKKISVITSYTINNSEINLQIKSKNISKIDLKDLIALLYRYKIDMTQLQIFLKESNRSWFYDNKKSYWHALIFNDN